MEAGALDDIEEEQWETLLPKEDDSVYVSKSRAGDTTVRISRKGLLPLLAEKLNQLSKDFDVVVMVCTGSFPELSTSTRVIYPDRLVASVVPGLSFASNLGLLVPLPEQVQYARDKWQHFDGEVAIVSSSPYGAIDPAEAAVQLRDQGAELIVLDCMAYTPWHRDVVRAATAFRWYFLSRW